MTNTKEIIIKLKEVRNEKNLSYGDILDLLEANGDFLSKSTISRVFQDDSENLNFRYQETIRPIAKALLDIETIEEDDDVDVQAMKSLLQYKIQRIEELEHQIEHLKASFDKERVQFHEKMEHERATWGKSIDFLKEQVTLKDKRMDVLLEAVQTKDAKFEELLGLVLSCPCRKAAENEKK